MLRSIAIPADARLARYNAAPLPRAVLAPIVNSISHPHSLPDVADDAARAARPLDWVGMQYIALPLRLRDDDGSELQVPASVDIFVDLQRPDARGIHMSRLYARLQDALAESALTPSRLRRVLQDCIDSQGVLSSSSRIVLRYDHLLKRAALVTANSGWKLYPVEIDATLTNDHLTLRFGFSVEYSSTCPASAALSRQANAERFAEDFASAHALSMQAVHDWIASERGLAATPHAQRSRAEIRLDLQPSFDQLSIADWVERAEAALGTPVQTAVKREDEQAFARLNADHLMFCEDAARRLAAAFAQDARVHRFDITVAHYESLHPHDAVARVSGTGGAGD
jgi:GTP cyclohydrolase IB